MIRLEACETEIKPTLELSAQGSGEPPKNKTAIGTSGEDDGSKAISERDLFWAFYGIEDPSHPLLEGLAETIEKYGLGEDLPPVSNKRVKQFLKDAEKRGLLERRLGIMEYIGAFLPRR